MPSSCGATVMPSEPAATAALPWWRLALGVAAVLAYAALSHWLMVHAADRPWAVAVLFGPLLAMIAGAAARRRHAPTLVATLAGALALVMIVSRGGLGDVNRLYLAQHAGTHALLFLVCAASLRPGLLSWIGQAAQRVHGTLTPGMAAYTTRVTRLWAGYFALMTAASVGVYLGCPWETWSLLANVVTPVVIGLLFVGEHLLRYRLHPEFERVTIARVVQAWSRPPAGATAVR